MGSMRKVAEEVPPVTPYDGCGRCLVATRRLSRKTDKTASPAKQARQTMKAAADNGGHIIGWADDFEVSGATDPLTRPGFGPWLRGEMGPYDGVIASAVDRVGRNVRDVLNTQALLTSQDRIIITADHDGVWDFSDSNEENNWLLKALGAQMELRNIQRRNRDETVTARESGYPKQRPSYGYMFVRLSPTARIDHVAIDEVAAAIIREVARRILADETGDITYNTEAARLNREGVPAPSDRRAELYARKPKGHVWTGKTVAHILTSEAALGYLMHGGRPVIGKDGKPTRIAEPLWDRPTHEALCAKVAPKRAGSHAPKGTQLLSGRSTCGNCGARLYLSGKRNDGACAYGCTGRVRGLKQSAECKPAPSIGVTELDAQVSAWFIARYGAGEVMRKVFDPGTGHAAQIADLTAARTRLKSDRDAGLYDDPDEEAWYRARYQEMTEEIKALRGLKDRKPGMIEISTGRTIAQEWEAADTARRREMLTEFDVRVVVNARKTGPGNVRQISGKRPRVAITGMEAPARMLEKAA
jgi:site-specific DNA recombinase